MLKPLTPLVLAALVGSWSIHADAQTYRQDRPIRGAWYRAPSGTATDMELVLQYMAQAGLKDLFVDTLYHGLSIGHAGVFNARYSTDLMAQLIPLAAKYNIRVHAWCESSYWQYGTEGAYNFTGHPDWQVISFATGATGGDAANQVFANLAHPGVQAKMHDYFAELAGYPGLWGVQTDYHRYPVDDNTSDVYTAPWSYDTYSASAMVALYGSNANINTKARKPGDQYWNQFLAWRRSGIVEAAHQMKLGKDSTRSSVLFSAAIFPTAMSSSAQIAKCQDWPTMASKGYIEVIVPMAYGSTTSSITSDLNTTTASAAGHKVVAGLALTGTSSHPAATDQLAAAKAANVHDFIFFEASALVDPAVRTGVAAWLSSSSNTPRMQQDFNNDGIIDERDYRSFKGWYPGPNRVAVTGANTRYDLNGDGWIDAADEALFNDAYRKYHFNDAGVIDSTTLAAFDAAFTGPGSGVLGQYVNLYDLDADGDVDNDDRVILYRLAGWTLCAADFNFDGSVDIYDFTDFVTAFETGLPTADFNRDGFIDFYDFTDFVTAFESSC